MLNHCFSLLNYFKLGISFFKEIRVVNSHIRYCLIFKFLAGFSGFAIHFASVQFLSETDASTIKFDASPIGRLSFVGGRRSRWQLDYYIMSFSVCQVLFSKFFEIFFGSETLLENLLSKRKLNMYNLSSFCCRLADSLIIIPLLMTNVNTFFAIWRLAYFLHLTE